MVLRRVIISSLALSISTQAAFAGPRVAISDPRYDDKGPGTYTYPSGAQFQRGTFDLREFAVHQDGDDVVFTVVFDAPITKPVEIRRGDASRIDLENNLYLQNVDIYVDSDPSRGSGFTEAVPGRNVRFHEDEAWESVVVLAPLPHEVRSALDGWGPGRRAIVPADLSSRGSRVVARVPMVALGGPLSASWGFQVLISGATWEASFDAVPRVLGEHRRNAYTMKVTTISENAAFGGGDLSIWHPAVIDTLSPPGADQFSFLGGWDAAKKRLATVPMYYPDRRAREVAVQRARMSAPVAVAPPVVKTATVASNYILSRVRSVDGDLAVLEKTADKLPQFSLGAVVDAEGQTIGRVVINAEYPEFLLAQVVQGAGKIEPGAEVRFEKPKKRGAP